MLCENSGGVYWLEQEVRLSALCCFLAENENSLLRSRQLCTIKLPRARVKPAATSAKEAKLGKTMCHLIYKVLIPDDRTTDFPLGKYFPAKIVLVGHFLKCWGYHLFS